MDGFLGRPGLPDELRRERLSAADRPSWFGPEWQPSVIEFRSAADHDAPAPMQAFVRLAGQDASDEVVAFSLPPFEETHHFDVEQVLDARCGVLTAPVEIIGLGAAGALAGALAHAADRAMSVWQLDLLLNERSAEASFKVHREPDPATLARLRTRLEFGSIGAPPPASYGAGRVEAVGPVHPTVGRHAAPVPSSSRTDATTSVSAPGPPRNRPERWDHKALVGLGAPPLPAGWTYEFGTRRLEIRAEGQLAGQCAVQRTPGGSPWHEQRTATADRMLTLAQEAHSDVLARVDDGRIELVAGRTLSANARIARARFHTVSSVTKTIARWTFMVTAGVAIYFVVASCDQSLGY